MNLRFIDVQRGEHNGEPVRIQRAPVVGSSAKQFWFVWRKLTDEQRKRFVLRKERGAWHVYRMMPLNPDAPLPPFEMSYYLKRRDGLLPYQPVAVQHLCNSILAHGAALDGSDTGLGKTYVALGVCRELDLAPAVVCKLAGISAWKKACLDMGIRPFFIVNWERAKNGKFQYAPRTRDKWTGTYSYQWKLPAGVLLIFDEAHKANHDGSQNCGLYVASKGHSSLSLSATVADRMTRLRPLLHLLGMVQWDRFPQWARRYGSYLQEPRDDEPVSGIQGMAESQDLLAVNSMLYPRYGYRLSYSDPTVKKWFPDAAYLTEVIDLSASATRLQNAMYRKLVGLVTHYRELGKQADALVADLRYRQEAELLKVPVLASLAVDYIEEGHSVVIFVNFRETLAQLASRLKTRSLIFGGQERQGVNREEVIRDFQSDRSRVVVAMAAAGGESISLHDVNGNYRRVSLICPTYDPVALRQVLGRTRRAGSKSVPVMRLVYAAGTVEEKVAAIVNRKLDNIAALNDGDLMEPDLFALGVGREA